jgi:hypothetical protein
MKFNDILLFQNYTQDDAQLGLLKFEGGDCNSEKAYYGIDMTADENIDQSISVGSFEWNVKKSNDNVRGISTGSGMGKRFSFYLARKAFMDVSRINGNDVIESENVVTIAKYVPEDYNLPIFVVIHSDILQRPIRIISSWMITEVNKAAIKYAKSILRRGDKKGKKRVIEWKPPQNFEQTLEKGLSAQAKAEEIAIQEYAEEIASNGKEFIKWIEKKYNQEKI